jgi:polyhydroxyalkanoate synthesis regulator phasin
VSAKTAAELREVLTDNLIRPLELVMLTRERIEEALNDAVSRGRVTTEDAQEIVGGLLKRGRKQTNDVLADLEQLLGKGRDEIDARTGDARKRGTAAARRARKQVEQATTRARKQAVRTADPVLAQADRARRAAGVGPTFPVTGYDDLTAAQVQGRLGDLSPAELRKVRDYERRHANRKTVLSAIGERLS